MRVYELNSVYFLEHTGAGQQIIVSLSADYAIPHIYPLGTGPLTDEFRASASVWDDDTLFIGCILYSTFVTYYFCPASGTGSGVKTLSFTLPRSFSKGLPHSPFKEVEILAFLRALKSKRALSLSTHRLAYSTLPELTFYNLIASSDTEILRAAGFVARFCIGYKQDTIYVHRNHICMQAGQPARSTQVANIDSGDSGGHVNHSNPGSSTDSLVYYISCSMNRESNTKVPAALISTNRGLALLENDPESCDDFTRQVHLILMGRQRRVQRIYLSIEGPSDFMVSALSKYGLIAVADRAHADAILEFAIHPLMLGLTTEYQLELDSLLEAITSVGNAKDKRLNRLMTATNVEELAERLLLQLDNEAVVSEFSFVRNKPASQNPVKGSRTKALVYAHNLIKVLSGKPCAITFSPFNKAPSDAGSGGHSLFLQSDCPVLAAKQLCLQYVHISLLTSDAHQASSSTLAGAKVYIGNRQYPSEWCEISCFHSVGLTESTAGWDGRGAGGSRNVLSYSKMADSFITKNRVLTVTCNIAVSATIDGAETPTQTPFAFDLIRIDVQEQASFILDYAVAIGSCKQSKAISSGLLYTNASICSQFRVSFTNMLLNDLICNLVLGVGRERTSEKLFWPMCHALSRYINGWTDVPMTLMALHMIHDAFISADVVSTQLSQPLLSSMYQKVQQLITVNKRKNKDTSMNALSLKLLTHPNNSFSLAHSLLVMLKAKKGETHGYMPKIMLLPNPILLEIIRLLVLAFPSILESSSHVKVILGCSDYQKIYVLESYLANNYIKLATQLEKLVFSTIAKRDTRAASTSAFDVLLPKICIKTSLYSHFDVLAASGNFSLDELVGKLETFITSSMRNNSRDNDQRDSFYGEACSVCKRAVTDAATEGTRCEKCAALFCLSCVSTLTKGIYYSSYNFTDQVVLCVDCSREEALLGPTCKILLSDGQMDEVGRGEAMFELLARNRHRNSPTRVELVDVVNMDADAAAIAARKSPQSQVDMGSIVALECLDSVFDTLAAEEDDSGNNDCLIATLKVAGTRAGLHSHRGCVCVVMPEIDSISQLADFKERITVSVNVTASLQVLYIAITDDTFPSQCGEEYISKHIRTYIGGVPMASWQAVSIPATGVYVFKYALDTAQIVPGTLLTVSLLTRAYQIRGYGSPIQHRTTHKCGHLFSPPQTKKAFLWDTPDNMKLGSNLIDYEVKLTADLMENQKLEKCFAAATFGSIDYPYKTLVKLTDISSKAALVVRISVPRGQRVLMPTIFMYHIASVTGDHSDCEKRKSKEGLVQMVANGIVTAVQIIHLPMLSMSKTQDTIYWYPLSLKSDKSTLRLILASTNPYTIVSICDVS